MRVMEKELEGKKEHSHSYSVQQHQLIKDIL